VEGWLIERIAPVGDQHSLAIDLAHVMPHLLALRCFSVIIHHSHESGNSGPSEADVAATRAFAELLRAIGMRLHDHLITGGSTVFSFRREGLI
jgi:DNA repair protein RadC